MSRDRAEIIEADSVGSPRVSKGKLPDHSSLHLDQVALPNGRASDTLYFYFHETSHAGNAARDTARRAGLLQFVAGHSFLANSPALR